MLFFSSLFFLRLSLPVVLSLNIAFFFLQDFSLPHPPITPETHPPTHTKCRKVVAVAKDTFFVFVLCLRFFSHPSAVRTRGLFPFLLRVVLFCFSFHLFCFAALSFSFSFHSTFARCVFLRFVGVFRPLFSPPSTPFIDFPPPPLSAFAFFSIFLFFLFCTPVFFIQISSPLFSLFSLSEEGNYSSFVYSF